MYQGRVGILGNGQGTFLTTQSAWPFPGMPVTYLFLHGISFPEACKVTLVLLNEKSLIAKQQAEKRCCALAPGRVRNAVFDRYSQLQRASRHTWQ